MRDLIKENFVPTDPEKYIPGINYMIRPDGRSQIDRRKLGV